jgi:hypothetical protein
MGFGAPFGWRAVPPGILKIVVFVLLPMLVYRITQMLILFSFLLTISPNPSIERPFWLRADAEGWMRLAICLVMVILPAAALAVGYHFLARRFQVARLWAGISFLLLAYISGSIFCNVQLSDIPGQSRICLGAAPSLVGWHTFQGVVPLLLGCWLTIRTDSRHAIHDPH